MRSFTSVALMACGLNTVLAGVIDFPLSRRAVSPDNTCGTQGTGGTPNAYTCPTELPCCSSNGFCGSTDDYCLVGGGCQSPFGTCKTPEAESPPPESPPPESPPPESPPPESPPPESPPPESPPPESPPPTTTPSGGLCGPGIGSCGPTECCSGAGFCGTGIDYCQAPDCQFKFGPACDAHALPTGTNTSSIPRPKAGNVLYGSAGIYDCTETGTMALTFDDGPYIYTEHVLDLLKQYNAKATFFVTGNNIGKGAIDDPSTPWPGLLRRMFAEGHQIASHSWSHADLCDITSAERKDEMYKLEMAVRNVLGVIPTYMRPPYSSCNAECGCEADMEELGYHITYFDLDTSDYLNNTPELIQNSKNLFDQPLEGKSPATDDFLLIAHDIHNTTSEVLTEYMLQGIAARGYRPVTVGTCLGDDQANWYRADASAPAPAK